ncbi:MAG: hypothetical protein SP1CHLAM54_02570 [Chlamydiia bacterium]|nr:hypothetical protein [Chlamydiia bacterium]MCH9615174.1 hypothetical protein [Chlamydiia bacterium]MCH9628504.1 hypothetical protein [Chlamydiia bacterium]
MDGQFDEKAFGQLTRLHTSAYRGKDGVSEFLELHNKTHLYDTAIEEIYKTPSLPEKIECSPDALEVLEKLKMRYPLALVTGGYDDVQREKLKRAGIDESIFSHIFVEPLSQKKAAYEKILEKVGLNASDVVVCGDRIELDLTPAKRLGIKTVHFRFGRGLGNTGLKSDVDYTILHLEELMDLLPRIESFA